MLFLPDNFLIRGGSTSELGSVLMGSPCLCTLLLSGNDLEDEEISWICDLLRCNHKITHLDLRGCFSFFSPSLFYLSVFLSPP